MAEQVGSYRVWAFGSRATGKYRWRYSDLDLAIEGSLTTEEREGLREALENVRVDVVELGKVDAGFVERVRGDFVVVRESSVVEPA